MKIKWLCGVVGVAWLTLSTGCVSTPDGNHVFAVPAKDKFYSKYQRPAREVWAAAKDVIRYNGALVGEDVLQSTLRGTVNERRVWVKVEELDDQVTQVIVQVRTRGGLTDLELAGEIDKQIAIRLATGNLVPGSVAYPPPADQP